MYSDNTKPIYLKIREDLLADLETNHNKNCLPNWNYAVVTEFAASRFRRRWNISSKTA